MTTDLLLVYRFDYTIDRKKHDSQKIFFCPLEENFHTKENR